MRSLFLLLSDDVRTDCVETGLPRNICPGTRGNSGHIGIHGQVREGVWFCVLLSVFDRNLPHRGV